MFINQMRKIIYQASHLCHEGKYRTRVLGDCQKKQRLWLPPTKKISIGICREWIDNLKLLFQRNQENYCAGKDNCSGVRRLEKKKKKTGLVPRIAIDF